MNERTPWICPRCARSNAPHVDYCDCAGGDAVGVPLPAPLPSIPPITVPYPIVPVPPEVAYPWWHPLYPYRITVSDTSGSISWSSKDKPLTIYATSEDNALLKFGQSTTTGVQ